MNLPFFFAEKIDYSSPLVLDSDTSKHIAQVLRMQSGEKLHLTDGAGTLALAQVITADKKACSVSILSLEQFTRPSRNITIAISLLKQPARFEWFLEKAAETGVSQIIPIRSSRTEKQQFRKERAEQILHSAMLQSRQVHKTRILELQDFKVFLPQVKAVSKWIAHCEEKADPQLPEAAREGETIILIGPEGDFTKDEIDFAFRHGFKPASLGETRLRTETAGLVAAVLLTIVR